ncbi:MAG: polymerase sigma factor, sigma-70 family [Planctomycetota bacterium]|nr:polymerase sigma factor, sigma-70 family [Planctomycetota bacterium]
MASGQLHAVFRQINRLFTAGSVSGLSEGQLLARFVEKNDEAAFEALVSRYGPMVLGVCRQILTDPHAAEDAFQATFLVLVKRAGSIRDRDLLGNWLYGVSLRVAKRARADLAKRRSREKEGAEVITELIGDRPAFDDPELGPILHEELARLPQKYRDPVVLCYLDGRTHEQAAELLRWPVGTVKGRLARAKDLLRERLGRRGVTASTAVLAATLAKTTEACVPPILLEHTVKAAMGLAAGGAVAAGLASATAVALSEGVVMGMTLTKLKFIVAAIVGAGIATGGVAVGMQGVTPDPGTQDAPKAEAKIATKPTAPTAPEGKTEALTTKTTPAPLEPGATNLGMEIDRLVAETQLPAEVPLAKLTADRVALAKQALDVLMAYYENGTITIDRLLQAAMTYMEAKAAAAENDPAARLKAIEDYVRLSKNIVDREKEKYRVGNGAMPNVTEAELRLVDARILLAKARAGTKGSSQPARTGAKTNPNLDDGVESDDPQGDEKIIEALARPISMAFTEDTPLEEVIKYIQSGTTGAGFEQGLPIYLDPLGLEMAEKTMNSPVRLKLEGIKLRTTLRLLLKQLNLGYYVKHGLVIITALESDEYKDATDPGWFDRQQKANREELETMRKMNAAGVMGGFGGGFGGGGMSSGGRRRPAANPPVEPPDDASAKPKATKPPDDASAKPKAANPKSRQ